MAGLDPGTDTYAVDARPWPLTPPAALTATVLPARGRGIAESMDGHTLVPSKTSRMSVGSRTQAWNLLREGQLGLFPPEASPLPPLGPPWGWPPSPRICFSLLYPRCRTTLCVDLQSVQGGPQGHAAFAALTCFSLASLALVTAAQWAVPPLCPRSLHSLFCCIPSSIPASQPALSGCSLLPGVCS